MSQIDENSIKVRRDLMLMASSNTLVSSVGVISITIMTVIAFWNIANHAALLLWLLFIVTSSSFRLIKSKNYLKNYDSISIFQEEKSFHIRTLSTATILIFGIIYLLPPDKPLHMAALTMILAGVTTAAVMSLGTHKKTVRAYLIIMVIPFILTMLIFGSILNNMMAGLTTLFLIVMLSYSKQYHNSIVSVIISKYVIEQSEKERKLSDDKFKLIFSEAPIGLFTYNDNLIIEQANQTFATYLNTQKDKLINLNMKNLRDKSLLPILNLALKGENGFYEGKYTTTISKKTMWIKMQTVPMYDTSHKIVGGIGIVEDITKRIKSERKIRYQAFYDNLTGLANRITFNNRLEEQISTMSKEKKFSAILFIDLDHFKEINDSLGHHMGDELLKAFASRATNTVRKEDTVARFGGDEFVILLSDLSSDEQEVKKHSQKIANKLHDLMKEPIKLENSTLKITLSIGIKIISYEESNINEIIKEADIAMYDAKESGRNKTCFFNEAC